MLTKTPAPDWIAMYSADAAAGGSRMTKDRIVKCVVTAAGLAAFALCILPLMSVRTGGPESGVLMVRGYNLMEFSALGCVPLFAPLFIPAITLGNQTKAAKETELLILFAANMVCYVHGFNAARIWLDSLGGPLLTFYPGMLLIPLAFSTSMGLSKVIKQPAYRDCMVLEDDIDDLPF